MSLPPDRPGSLARLGKFLLAVTGLVLVALVPISPVPLFAGVALYLACLVVRPLFAPRKRPGLCGKCGFDIRYSYARCPECGTPFDTSGQYRYRDVTPERSSR